MLSLEDTCPHPTPTGQLPPHLQHPQVQARSPRSPELPALRPSPAALLWSPEFSLVTPCPQDFWSQDSVSLSPEGMRVDKFQARTNPPPPTHKAP